MAEDPDPQARRPTRRDVARLAGVSEAVVSYTLSGRAPVAAGTAQRVRDAIEALGYVPNVSAQALRSGSSHAIALIAAGTDDPVLANPFFVELARAAERAAQARGYALFMSTALPGRAGLLARAQDFAARHVDGLLVLPAEPGSAAELDLLGVPWVQLSTAAPHDGVRSVGVDLYDGAFRATTHLIDHGHDRIGFVGASSSEVRARAWRDACRARGVAAGPLVRSGYDREDGRRAAARLLDDPDRPTACFAASDLIGLGVLRAAHERGVRVPEELALVSLDGSWASDSAWPRLTAVRQPIERMAEAAIGMLLDPGIPTHREFQGELVIRESCGSHAVLS